MCGYGRKGDVIIVTCTINETEFKEYVAALIPNTPVLIITDLK